MTSSIFRTSLAAALTATSLVASPVHAAPAKSQADWTHIVTLEPNGAYLLGNPAAKTRLVEYFSYTCSHCAHFMVEAMGPLRTGWIRQGLVALEFRNLVRDPYDATAALLARCGGKARFLANHEALFNNFDAWIPKIEAFAAARDPNTPARDQATALGEIADKTGLTALLSKAGLTQAAQRACLGNKEQFNTVIAMTKEATEKLGVTGTPSFLINNMLIKDAHNWATLKPQLPALPGAPK